LRTCARAAWLLRVVRYARDLCMRGAQAQAGDRLVIVDFYAKWCNACRALFPKVRRAPRAVPPRESVVLCTCLLRRARLVRD